MEDQKLMRNAVLAARYGQRHLARALFLQAAEQDPNLELAWLWLSELQETPAERIAALERALSIRPSNLVAAERLERLRGAQAQTSAPAARFAPAASSDEMPVRDTGLFTQPEPPTAPLPVPLPELPTARSTNAFTQEDDLETESTADEPAQEEQDILKEARRLAKQGQIDPALGLLYGLVETQPKRGDAWLLIAQITPRTQEKISALQKVAEIYPKNRKVRAHLKRLQALDRDPFLAGLQHEERGEREQAMLVYESIKVHSRSPADRMEAIRRMDNLRLIEEAERLQPVNPTLNLLRLAIGPVILFTLLIFIQSGLNPLKLPLVALLGEVSVLAGSLLVNVTSLRPMHPRWVKAFGRPGTPTELETRFDLRLLGWALLAAPFIIFFITALHRLLQFRAAMEY